MILNNEYKDLEFQFFERMNCILKLSYISYNNYFKNGKTFHYADIIKDSNEELTNLIIVEGDFLPPPQRQYLIEVKNHLQAWRAQWDDLREQIKPELDSEFIFETRVKFPKEALSYLSKYSETKFNIVLL